MLVVSSYSYYIQYSTNEYEWYENVLSYFCDLVGTFIYISMKTKTAEAFKMLGKKKNSENLLLKALLTVYRLEKGSNKILKLASLSCR
jgi:hypothetical protein